MSPTEQKNRTVPNRTEEPEDRRAQRTRQLLRQAFMDLMHTQRFEDITVQDIIDRANVGRSTFYAHYQDKEDLATQFFEAMMEDLTRGVKSKSSVGSLAFPITEMFDHLKSQAAAHGAWLDSRGREFLFSVGQAYWVRRIERELKASQPAGRPSKIPLPVIAQMIVGAATGLLQWWMNNKAPYTPEEMQQMFDRVLLPGIKNAMDVR